MWWVVISGLWSAYDNVGYIKRAWLMFKFIKEYTFFYRKNPDVVIRCKKLFVLNSVPANLLDKIATSIVESGQFKVMNGLDRRSNYISFGLETSRVIFDIKVDIDDIGGDEKNVVSITSHDLIFAPFRNFGRARLLKEDMARLVEVVHNQLNCHHINELVMLDVNIEEVLPEGKRVEFIHDGCQVICSGKKIQVNGVTGKEYEPLLKSIMIRWHKELF